MGQATHDAKQTPLPTAVTTSSQLSSRPFAEGTGQGAEAENFPQLTGFDLLNVPVFAGGAAPPSPSAELTPSVVQRQTEGDQVDEDEGLDDKIQRNCETCAAGDDAAGDAEEMPPIQAKLTIGAVGDRYEQEADRTAAQVVSMPEPTVQRKTEATSETQFLAPTVQAKDGAGAASAEFEQRLGSTKGSGAPLGEDVRSFMEPRFGADFSQVRVHTGESAVQMNREVRAQAFTHGTDIYFNSGKFEPDSAGGKELLAHELTHTIQQTGRRNLQRKELNRDRHKPQLAQLNLPQNNEDKNVEPNDETRQILSRDQVDLNKENKAKPLTKNEPKPEVISNSPQALSEVGKPEQLPIDQTANLDPQSSIPNTPVQTPIVQTPIVQPPKNAQGSEETAKNNIVDFGPSSVAKQNKADSSETKSFSPQPSPTPVATAFAQSMDVANNAGAAVNPSQFPQAQTIPTQGGTGAIAPGSPGLEIPTASGAVPALDAGPSGAEEAAAPEVGDDPELDAVVQETAGVELPTEAKEEASADLSAIGAEGGEAPASMGGGGGGGAIADKPTPPTPDVSQSDDPAQALATVANLPPVQLQSALGGVGAAVDKSVNKEKNEIANNPPQMEVGAEGVADSATDKAPSSSAAPKAVEKAPEGQPKPTPEPKPLPNLPAPAKAAVTPAVQGGTDGKLSSQDVQNLQASLNRLPTTDPAASTLKADAPPPLKLEGDANPQQAQEQRAKLESSVNETYTQGQKEVSQPLGEDQIKATVPKELIKAEAGGQTVAGGAAMPAVAQAGGDAEADDGISVIAQEKHGAEIQAAVAQAQGQMAAERQGHQAKVAQERQKSQEDINKLQADNAAEQNQEKLKAKTEADQLRSDWTKEQDQLVAQSRKEADDEVSKGNQEVQTEQVQAEQKAQQEIEAGNQKAEVERQKGEQQAETERQKGQKESGGGFFGWLADKAKAFFDGIKQAIQQAFEAARAAIKSAIEAAQKLATAAIEAGRKAIVGIIRRVGDKLIALGDKLLANFPQVRDRFRKLIQDKVKQAEAAVNRIADNLKKNVKAALDLLAKGLDAALGLLQKGLMAAVDIAGKVVQGAISAAKAAAEALGTFAVLIKDIASNPGQWISNLAAGVMDGIKNHLWGAFQTAIQEWFNQKLEEVLGIGLSIWNVLKQGGINLAEIGKMAWEGIKAAIPPALIQILIEKVVAMIIPAAGAVLAIIEGLQAAWGTVSRIIQAMERFVGFLKAVKSGGAGPLFGQLLAAAGVVLVDFVSNWLLKRVRGAASKVASKIKAIAQKIGNKLKGVFAKMKKGAGKFKDKFFGKKDSKDGKAPHNQSNKKEEKDRKNKEKLNKAVAAIKPQTEQLLKRGTSKLYLKSKLLYWKLRYGLSALTLDGNGLIKAKVNPEADVLKTKDINLGKELLQVFAKAEKEYERQLLSDPKNKTRIDTARQKWADREPQSLAGLSRYEQSLVIRDTHVPRLDLSNAAQAAKKGAKEVEPGVRVWVPSQGGSRGMVQGVTKYDALLKNIQKKAISYGLSEQEVASIIFGKSSSQQSKLNILKMRMEQVSREPTGDISKKAAKSIDIFSRQLQATALLTQSFESSRVAGIATTTAVSSAMVMGGHASLTDVLSSEGKMAPMTPKGAAPEHGKALNEEQKMAEDKRHERVGNTFRNLLATAKSQKVVVTEGGYDLSGLVNAIEAWLAQKATQSPQALAANEAILQAELIKMLSSSH